MKFCSREGAEHEEKSIERRTDNWDLARGGGWESDKDGLCGAQYQHGDLPRVEEEVWRDGSQRTQEVESIGRRELAAQRLVADQAVQIHILKEVNAKRGEPVCKMTGCEDECGRRHWKSGGSLSGAGTFEIELLSQGSVGP